MVMLSLLVGGCGKKEEAGAPAPEHIKGLPTMPAAPASALQPAVAPPPTEGTAAAPAAAPAADAPALPGPNDANLLPYVQGAIESFLNGEGRNPTSFDEVIKKGYLRSLPAAPPGKKFMFDKETSSAKLVNQ